MQYVVLVVKYWPVVPAALYLAYVVTAGKTDQISPAIAALVAAFAASTPFRPTRRSTPSNDRPQHQRRLGPRPRVGRSAGRRGRARHLARLVLDHRVDRRYRRRYRDSHLEPAG